MEFADLISNAAGGAGLIVKYEQDKVKERAVYF
jgi:hypothetical protein